MITMLFIFFGRALDMLLTVPCVAHLYSITLFIFQQPGHSTYHAMQKLLSAYINFVHFVVHFSLCTLCYGCFVPQRTQSISQRTQS